MSFLKLLGIVLMVFVSAVAGYLYVQASRLEQEIEAENPDQGEQ